MPKPTPTSPSTSTSKPKRAWAALAALAVLPLLAATLFLGGCMAYDETRMYADEPLGKDYLPVVTRPIDLWPKKVLILPVSGDVEDEARNLFEAQFGPTLRDKMRWFLVPYPGIDSTRATLAITQGQAIAKAKDANCDTILFVKLSQQRIYDPLRLVVDVFMQDVETRKTVLTMHADYDVNNLAVVESARRYAKDHLPKNESPEKSRAVVHHLDQFLGFTGYYTAKLIADSFIVPSKLKAKALPVEGVDYSGKFAEPPAGLGGNGDDKAKKDADANADSKDVIPAPQPPPPPPAPAPAPAPVTTSPPSPTQDNRPVPRPGPTQ